jgi:DNA repair protein RecO (recombination protein O)
MEMTPAVRHEVEELVRDFLRYHVEEAYPDRGQEVIAQLEQDPSPVVPSGGRKSSGRRRST